MNTSPPVWGRGLKQSWAIIQHVLKVAPRVGAWIETLDSAEGRRMALSPPVWGRGLKLAGCADCTANDGSPPVWGRGLKLVVGGVGSCMYMSPPVWGRGLKQ